MVSKLKLDEVVADTTKKHIFGIVAAFLSVTEFQKRGLPQANILVILNEVLRSVWYS